MLVGGEDEAGVTEQGGGETEVQGDLDVPRLQSLAAYLRALKTSSFHWNLFGTGRRCQHVPLCARD